MTALAFLVLLVVTVAWFALPLLPAFRELYDPTDTEPLRVVERDAGDVAFFARGFRRYLERQLAALPAGAAGSDWYGRFRDGTPVLLVHALPDALRRGPRPDGAHDRVVVIEPEVTLAGGETFLLEVAARGTLHGGHGGTFRALDGLGDIHLGPASMVLRWVHADGVLSAGERSGLYGRASAGRELQLGAGVTFERLAAPVIRILGQVPSPASPPPTAAWNPPERAVAAGDHLRIPGDVTIPEATAHEGHVVVRGTLRLGPAAAIDGSVKAHRGVALESGATVRGAIVSRTHIVLGRHTRVTGPLIAEDEILIDEGSIVGSPEAPTTVVAPRGRLAAGVVDNGQVKATEGTTGSA